ncbi:hypothetical protein [Clostridium sp. L74]|uniref:hypothetical protein n=1 Tax=Clostridium sp. L74 TaxID=1560217 RepID=UPI0006AB8BC1|nr:hypothetical protein [Clostridium sp. L74]KOR26247.1 hypothetical protein ND00_08680 [Clostridium sp. L74]
MQGLLGMDEFAKQNKVQYYQGLQKIKYLDSKAKSKVEPNDKQGVHRVINTATTSGETNALKYGSLERILSRQNMQLDYKILWNSKL